MGFSDVGFSLHAVPTYYPMSEYFRQRAEVQGLTLKNVLYGRRAPWRVGARDFRVWVLAFSSVLRGVIISAWVLPIDQVGQVLWLICKMSNYTSKGSLYMKIHSQESKVMGMQE